MNNFLMTLLLSVLLLSCIGWATYWLHHNHGPAGERVFRSLVALMVSGFVLLLTFGTNYIMASTGLKRSFGSEKIIGDDPVARVLFGGSHMRSNHLIALAIVVISFVGSAYFLKFLGRAFEAVRDGSWRQNRLDFALLLLKLVAVAYVAAEFLRLDTGLLLARTALMMYSEEYGAMGVALPKPEAILQAHGNEIGGYLLGIFVQWYPLYILMAEKHFSSCRAHYNAACRDLAASRVQAEAALNGAPVEQVAPAPGPVPAAPQPAPGVVLPELPIVVPGGGPQAPQHNGPMPGGAAGFVRPIPFNPGPQERNGHAAP